MNSVHVVLSALSLRLFVFVHVCTSCRYGCMYALAVCLFGCVDVMVM